MVIVISAPQNLLCSTGTL